MTVEISRAAFAAMLDHAAQSSHREICGLLLGTRGGIETARPAENVAAQTAQAFELDPSTMFDAIRAARLGGPEMIGHYHSHPGGSTVPSAHDRANALDVGQLWVIVAGGGARAWRVSAPGRLEAVELALATDCVKRQ